MSLDLNPTENLKVARPPGNVTSGRSIQVAEKNIQRILLLLPGLQPNISVIRCVLGAFCLYLLNKILFN